MRPGTIVDRRGFALPETQQSVGGYYAPDRRRRKYQGGRRSQPLDEDRVIGSRDLQLMRLECLDQARANPIVASVADRISDNVVGPRGIRPQAKTSSEDWNDQAEAWWADYGQMMDVRERLNMREYQKLVVQGRIFMGDTGHVFIDSGQVQPVEADRVGTPKEFFKDSRVINGVRVDGIGRTVGYYVLRRDDKGRVDPAKFDYRPADQFNLVSNPDKRFDRLRSEPELSPILDMLIDFGEITEATLIKVKMDAARGHIITTEAGPADMAPPGSLPRGSAVQTGSSANGQPRVSESFDFGMNTHLFKGEKAESFAGKAPNPQHVQYCEMILRIMSSAMRVPYEFLLLDFQKGSYSISRTALRQTQRTFEMYQAWLIDQFLQRLWNWRIAKAIRERDLPPAPMDPMTLKSQWSKVEWSLPAVDWIDPKSETQADKERFKMGAQSLTATCRKSGTTSEVQLREKGADILIAIQEADRINSEAFADVVTWKDLIDVQMPGQVGAPITVSDEG